ncbi:hypothetical protein Agub_g1226, partial [Astrephomene gubernaculifera]
AEAAELPVQRRAPEIVLLGGGGGGPIAAAARGAAARRVVPAPARPAAGEAASLIVVGCAGRDTEGRIRGVVMLLRLLPPGAAEHPQTRPAEAEHAGRGAASPTGVQGFGSVRERHGHYGDLHGAHGSGSGGGAAAAHGPDQPAGAVLPAPLQMIQRLVVPKPVTAVCPYDSCTLAVAAGRRLLFYRLREARLHRTGWHATRNPATQLAACANRRLLAATDGTTGVVLYGVVHAEADTPGGPDGPPVALRLIAADTVPRAVTSLLLLPPPPVSLPAKDAEEGSPASATAAAEAGDASGASTPREWPEAMEMEEPEAGGAEDAAAAAAAAAAAGAASQGGAANNVTAAAAAATSQPPPPAPPVIAVTDSAGRLLLLTPDPHGVPPRRHLTVLAEAQGPDVGLRLRALLPSPTVRYNADTPAPPPRSAPSLLLAGLSGAVQQLAPCPAAAAPLLVLLERAMREEQGQGWGWGRGEEQREERGQAEAAQAAAPLHGTLAAQEAAALSEGGAAASSGAEAAVGAGAAAGAVVMQEGGMGAAAAAEGAAGPAEEGAVREMREEEEAGREGEDDVLSWWRCPRTHGGVLEGQHLELLLQLPPRVGLRVLRRVPREVLAAALRAAGGGDGGAEGFNRRAEL